MTIHLDIVPGPAYANGEEVLQQTALEATRFDAAVAFVTWTGVESVTSLVKANETLKIHLVARGAPITDPECEAT